MVKTMTTMTKSSITAKLYPDGQLTGVLFEWIDKL